MNSDQIKYKLKNGLIVSCQGEADSPFNDSDSLARFALAAEKGGAVAIRAEGVENIRKIKEKVSLPVIGLIKSVFEDGSVKITGSQYDVEQLIDIPCDIIAVDGTERMREGMTGAEFIHKIKKEKRCIIMADIASDDEAKKCLEAGADFISTTLSGYTPETQILNSNLPDFILLEELVQAYGTKVPVIAEGRYNSPELAKKAIDAGAWAVVVGTAISRPVSITKWFVNAIQ